MNPEIFENRDQNIQPRHIWPNMKWKTYISNALEKFGRYASIAVAIWTIIAMIKGLCNWLNGILLVKKLTNSHKQTAKYALSPSYFLLKGFRDTKKNDNEGNNPIIQKTLIGGSEKAQLDEQLRNPLTGNNDTLDQLRKLNEQLPVYKK